MKKRLINISAAALAFLACAGNTLAVGTLEVKVDPTTWAFVGYCLPPTGTPNVENLQVMGTNQYGQTITRYYFAGDFDVVNIRNANDCSIITSLSPCHNMFYLQGTTANKCSNGYNGTGDGTGGIVSFAKAANNGDLYIGGSFSSAGGWAYSSCFSCFRFNEGWSGVNGIFANGQVRGMSWDTSPGTQYTLIVSGDFSWVSGPLYSGGPIQTLNTPFGTARWHDYYKTLPQGWWTQP
jgi:hypothetical protein